MAIKPCEKYQDIWDQLMRTIGNPYSAAAVMGNLYAESTMNEKCMTGKAAKSWNADSYIAAISGKSYTRDQFAHDGIAFGLVQWVYWSRKEALYDFTVGSGIAIGNYMAQINFMLLELPKYKTVWNTLRDATDIPEASDTFMLRYEKPANQSEVMKERRRKFAQEFFLLYSGQQPSPEPSPDPEPTKKKIVRAINSVNIRTGNGKNNPKVGAFAKGQTAEWIATEDGWHKIALWVSGDFSTVEEEK